MSERDELVLFYGNLIIKAIDNDMGYIASRLDYDLSYQDYICFRKAINNILVLMDTVEKVKAATKQWP